MGLRAHYALELPAVPVEESRNGTRLGRGSLHGALVDFHLLHWLGSNNYGVSLSDNDLYIKVRRMVYLSDRSDFKAGRNYCTAQLPAKLPCSASSFALAKRRGVTKTW